MTLHHTPKTCTFTENPLTTSISHKLAASNLQCLSGLFLDRLESEDWTQKKLLCNASNCSICQSPQCYISEDLNHHQNFIT